MNEARAPTDAKIRGQVLADYQSGIKPKALSEKYGISVNTIKSWIKRQKDRTGKVSGDAPSKAKDAPIKKKKGAPVGNKNAVGSGAPAGNKNAWKHGGYSAVYWDALDEQEHELINTMPDDEEEILLQQIMLFSVRERRLMHAINKYREIEDDVYISSTIRFDKKRSFSNDEEKKLYDERVKAKVKSGDRLPGEAYSMQTFMGAAIDLIARLEKELTSVQSQKTKAVDALAKFRTEKEKIAGESKGNEVVYTWAQSVIKARRDKDGQ